MIAVMLAVAVTSLKFGGSRHHELVVNVECDDPQGSQQAQDRLERWISTFGHTAPPATDSRS
jgi:hypothetical protein